MIKFYRGVKANYNYNTASGTGTHADGIYFATDTNELMMNGVAYGISSSQASALSTLAGGSNVEGSVAYQIAQVINGAPEAYDTLKEIADWITADTTGAAAILSDVANKANKVDMTGAGAATENNFFSINASGDLKDSGYSASSFDAAGTAASAIAALDATVSQTAASGNGKLALSITETNGVITAISGSITANTYDAYGAASTAKSDVIGANTDAASANTVYGAKAYADDAIAALDASKSQTAGTDGLALSITETDGKITAISGSIAANTYDAYGAASTVKSQVVGANTDAASANTIYGAKAYADSVAAGALNWIEA